MRSDPSDRAEMVNQLLQGDTFEILEQQEKWSLVRCDYDGYEGWVDNKQWKPTTANPNLSMGNETSPATYAEQQQYVVHFIEDNLGSLTTLIALYKPFNNHPLIDPSNSFEFYEAVLEGLQEYQPDNPHPLHFKNMVERTRYQYAQ